MGSCSCTRRHFLLSICFLQMITIIERQAFDFLGYMWAPILVNFFQILFIIFGFYGAYHFRIKYIITYLLWNFIWIGWNAFLICFYLDVGTLNRNEDLLNLGTGSVSWFEANGYGCKPIYNITAEDPFRPLRPQTVEDCLLDYQWVEVIHSAVQSALALLGILGAILISCIFLDEDDRFDFMNGDAKSPQHTVVHPMYVSYTSIPTTSASATMQSNKQLQLQQMQQQQQLQLLQEQQQHQQQNSLQFYHQQHQRHKAGKNCNSNQQQQQQQHHHNHHHHNNNNSNNSNNNSYSNCNSNNNTLNNIVHQPLQPLQPQPQPDTATANNHNAYQQQQQLHLTHNNSNTNSDKGNSSNNSNSRSHSQSNSSGSGSNNASLSRLKSQSSQSRRSKQQQQGQQQQQPRLYKPQHASVSPMSMSMSPQSAQSGTPSLSYASLQNSNPQLATSLSNSNYSIFHAAQTEMAGGTAGAGAGTGGHFARIHQKPKPPRSLPDVKYTQLALDRLSRNLEEDEDSFSLQHLSPNGDSGVTYVPFQSPTPNSLFVGGENNNAGPPHIVFNSFHEANHSSPNNNNGRIPYAYDPPPSASYSPRPLRVAGTRQVPRPTQIPLPTVPIHSCHGGGMENPLDALSPPPPPAPRPHIFQPRLGQAPYPDLSPEIAEKYAMPTQHVGPGSPMVRRSQRRPRPQLAQANFVDIVRAQSDDRLEEQQHQVQEQLQQAAPHVNRRSGRKARPRSFCNSIVGAQA